MIIAAGQESVTVLPELRFPLDGRSVTRGLTT
ncbi:hypothetical protein J3R03_003902 [Actinoplanes couchii]|nr:hypothetical protein [Actinoplanes couchii]